MNNRAKYLIEGISKDAIARLMAEENLNLTSAIELFYNSHTFELLSDPSTGLYIESSAYVYEILKAEKVGIA